jgi:S-adenosylmethionine synthetase
MSHSFVFSSESVSEGHPDKVCDVISDAVLDACLTQDKYSRVACETMAKNNLVVLAGEITTRAKLNLEQIVRKAIHDIGYNHPTDGFHADKVHIMNCLSEQSPDIAQGVDARKVEGKKTAQQGAGDQGIMFGYACNETPELMPAPIMYAHQLARQLARLRKVNKVAWLRPDSKTQVSVEYVNNKPVRIHSVVISTQHTPEISHKEIEDFIIKQLINKVLPKDMLDEDTKYYINPTGRFVTGGPEGDAGLTGRKIIVDTYGGMGRHGGGAFSGKDPSKVDRSAAYMARYAAKNIVAAKLAERVEIQVAYAIGYPDPVSIFVNTFGTGFVDDQQIAKALPKVFSFKPAEIIKQLNLLRPIYSQTTQYGHFGRAAGLVYAPWENTDKAATLRKTVLKNS